MSDRDASLDEASNIAFKALKEKPPAKPEQVRKKWTMEKNTLLM